MNGSDRDRGADTAVDEGEQPGVDHGDGVLVELAAIAQTNVLTVGEETQLTAIGTRASGQRKDVTKVAEWSSSDESIAVVEDGMVTAVAPGQVMITASHEGMAGSVAFSVHSHGSSVVALDVSAPNPTLPTGTTMQLSATAVFGDGTQADVTGQATWTVVGQSFATVDSSGRATGVAVGAALATAQLDGMSGTLPLVVTTASFSRLEIDPAVISWRRAFSHWLMRRPCSRMAARST